MTATTYTIRTLLVLLGLFLVGWAPFMLFSGMPVWYGLTLIAGQFFGFGMVLFGALSRCWE